MNPMKSDLGSELMYPRSDRIPLAASPEPEVQNDVASGREDRRPYLVHEVSNAEIVVVELRPRPWMVRVILAIERDHPLVRREPNGEKTLGKLLGNPRLADAQIAVDQMCRRHREIVAHGGGERPRLPVGDIHPAAQLVTRSGWV